MCSLSGLTFFVQKSNAIDDTIESIASTQLPLKFDQKMSVTASAGAKTIDSGKKTNSSQSISASCDVQGKMGNSSVPQVNSKSFALPKPRLSACPPSSSMMRKSNHKSDKIQVSKQTLFWLIKRPIFLPF